MKDPRGRGPDDLGFIRDEPEPGSAAFDDAAVDRFAEVLKAKMAKSRAKGRYGWWDPEDTSHAYMLRSMHEHIAKGDPLDVALFAMFLDFHGWATISLGDMLKAA